MIWVGRRLFSTRNPLSGLLKSSTDVVSKLQGSLESNSAEIPLPPLDLDLFPMVIRSKFPDLFDRKSNSGKRRIYPISQLNLSDNVSQALSREEIMEVIGNIITDLDRETYVAKYGEGEVERFNAKLDETESRLNKLLRKDKDLILEQVEITYPKKMHSTHA